jgi:PAS domain S-box-containing protein
MNRACVTDGAGSVVDDWCCDEKELSLMPDLHAPASALSLQSTDPLLQATFDAVGIGLGHIALNGTWLRVNAQLCALLGYSADELLGQAVQLLIHPDDWTTDLLSRQRLSESAQSYTVRTRCLRRDGSPLWTTLTVSLLRDQTGGPLCFVVAVEDVTALVETECALQYSEARHQHTHLQRTQHAVIERDQRLLDEALHDVLVALAETDEITVALARILAAVATVVAHETSAIILLAGETAHIAHVHGFDTAAAQRLVQRTFPIQATICAKLQARRQPIQLNHTLLLTPQGLAPLFAPGYAVVCAPIFLTQKLIGALVVQRRVAGPFLTGEIAQLQLFAAYAGLAHKHLYHAQQLEAIVATRTAELQASIAQVEAILDHSPNAKLLLTADLTIQRVNRVVLELFTGTLGDFLHKSFLTMVDPADVDRVHQAMSAAVVTDSAQSIEAWLLRRDGERFIAELSIGKMQHGGLVCTLRDISERKAQERIWHYHASLQSHVSDAVIAKDLAMRIQSWNHAAEQIYGWRAEEVIGRPISEIIQTEETPAEQAHTLRLLHEQGWWRGEVVQRRRDGTRLQVLRSVTLLKEASGQPYGVVTVNHDVTALRAALAHEKELVALKERMAAVEKERELAELKERFVYMASHEFRTPLATVLAITETLSAYRTRMDERQIEDRLAKMRSQLTYMSTMVEDVLQLAALQSQGHEFKPVPTDLDKFCHTLVNEFKAASTTTGGAVERQIEYHCRLAAALEAGPFLPVDQKLMQRVLTNLLSNAVKYSAAEQPIAVAVDIAPTGAIITVRDAGMGIPAADMKHLFEPFHRAANAEMIHGTGLGLTIVKEAVELHGGTISVESTINEGTVFTVRLPRPAV